MKEFDEAIELANRAEKIIKLLKSNYLEANKLIHIGKKLKSDLEMKGITTNQIGNNLQVAEDNLRNNKFEDAKKITNNSIQILRGLESDYLSLNKVTDSINSEISTSKSINNDLLNNIDESIIKLNILKEKGDYDKALSIANQILDLLLKTRCDYLKSKDILEKAQQKLAEIKNVGIDTGDIEPLLNKAILDMDNREYKSVITESQKFIDSAEQAIKEYFEEKNQRLNSELSNLKEELKKANNIGADIREAEEIYNHIKDNINELDLNPTFDRIEKCKKVLNNSINVHQIKLKKFQSAQELIDETQKMGGEVSTANQFLF
ncbi:MAG: hypothetical protein ACFFG0_52170, partial [Candidatus Thorarchaeota archaeon]